MKKLFIAIIINCLMASSGLGQLNFTFLPEVYGRNLDGIASVQIQNLSNKNFTGSLVITITEIRTKAQVVTIHTPITNFSPGASNLSKGVYVNSRFNFANNALASIVNQTRSFPPGEYSFCFRFVSADKQSNDDFENCFEATIEPLLPINLIYPANEDTICLKRPILSWQPPMPYHSSMRFRLLLSEKKGESGTEDLLKNIPLLLLDNISTTTINYPSANPELKEGKSYYWQVIAYQQGVILSKSEVWEFTVQCKESNIPSPNDSYRELRLLSNGNYYIANGYLKFSFQNSYNVKKLSYTIQDIGKGSEEIKSLPEIKIQSGLNKIDLDLTELNLKPGNQYLLKVYPFNESVIEVRFIYQEKL